MSKLLGNDDMRSGVLRIVQEVSSWQSVQATPHRFGGTEFTFGKVEIGHIHANGMVDIPFTRKLREALVNEGDALPHHLLDESGWITYYVRSDADADHALRLYRLSYLQKRAHRDQALTTETYRAELATLGFSSAVEEAMPALHKHLPDGAREGE